MRASLCVAGNEIMCGRKARDAPDLRRTPLNCLWRAPCWVNFFALLLCVMKYCCEDYTPSFSSWYCNGGGWSRRDILIAFMKAPHILSAVILEHFKISLVRRCAAAANADATRCMCIISFAQWKSCCATRLCARRSPWIRISFWGMEF